jgi:hypothetical protein
MSDIPVAIENTGNDYVLKIEDFYIIDTLQLPIEMNNIVITPLGSGYKLSRVEPITFIIPEVYVPPIPPLLPEGGIFYDVPVKVTLGNSQIIDYVLILNIEVVATVTVVIVIPIPIPITFNMDFEGMLFSPPIITTATLPIGTVGKEYNAILESDGITPIIWSIFDGALPIGLQLDSLTGAISGIPTQDSVFQFMVKASNISGSSVTLFNIEIEKMDTVKINTPEVASWKVYPNPTSGELKIENGEWRMENVEVFDMMGRLHNGERRTVNGETQSHASRVTCHKINISHLPTGIYFLKIETEKGTVMKKVVKSD